MLSTLDFHPPQMIRCLKWDLAGTWNNRGPESHEMFVFVYLTLTHLEIQSCPEDSAATIVGSNRFLFSQEGTSVGQQHPGVNYCDFADIWR